MDVFSDIESSKHFLDNDSLLAKVKHVLSVDFLDFSVLDFLAGSPPSDKSLDSDRCFEFDQELFPFGVHSKSRLDF